MPQLVKKRRSGWAVLAAGALIASILAVGASPAAAVRHRADVTPNWSACVGAAGTHDEEFTDVNEDNVHVDAINCIAYYGVTVGKGDGTYAPDEHVSAFQMGLFVQRAADLMGADGEAVLDSVELSDTVTRLEMAELMFGLLDDLHDWIRINDRSGYIQFDRDDDGTWQYVDDYFADARAEVPIFESDLIGAVYELGVTRGRSTDVSTDDSVFSPSDPVNRAQMASFITRALDHSNLRPEGLAAQRNNDEETQVSYRDADFEPIEDARVDAFSSLYPDDAFDPDDGECEGRFTKDETPSFTSCEIDIGDQFTDDDGNVDFTLLSDEAPITTTCMGNPDGFEFETATGASDDRAFWVWTGDMGDEVDEDTDLTVLEDVDRPVAGDPPDHAHISNGLSEDYEIAKMGETVTFNVQIHTEGRGPARPETHEDIGPDRSSNPYLLTVRKYWVLPNNPEGEVVDATGATVVDGTAAATADEDFPGYDYVSPAPNVEQADDRSVLSVTRTEVSKAVALFNTPIDTVVFPNASGAFNITLTHRDNDPEVTAFADVGVLYELTPFRIDHQDLDRNLLVGIQVDDDAYHVLGNGEGDLGNSPNYTTDASPEDNGGSQSAVGRTVFSDKKSRPTLVEAAPASDYRIIGPGSIANTVTVTVYDQYADPIRSVGVLVSSSLDTDGTDEDEPDQVRYPEEADITVQANEENRARVDGDYAGLFRTRRNGAYRIGYTFHGDDPAAEVIQPELAFYTRGDDPDTEDDLGTTDVVENLETDYITGVIRTDDGDSVTVYWAEVGESEESSDGIDTPGAVDVLAVDVPNRLIVANEGVVADPGDGVTNDPDVEAERANPMVYYYDDEDTFIVGGIGATIEMFEEALSATWSTRRAYPDTVQWESYDYGRPRDRAIWELTLSCEEPGTDAS